MADRTPMLLIHGFTGEPRTWDPLRPYLEPHHELLAPATLGHCGGRPVPAEMPRGPLQAMADDLERHLDEAGWETAHLVGSSLGGQLAIELGARGRARSVVAIAPGGGWEAEQAVRKVIGYFRRTRRLTPWAAQHAEQLVARPGLRRLVLRDLVSDGDRVPAGVALAALRGAADCTMFEPLSEAVTGGSWRSEELAPIAAPVRVLWGTADRVLPMEHASGHWRGALADAEWVELDGLGHLPYLDHPEVCAPLVLGLTRRVDRDAAAASPALR